MIPTQDAIGRRGELAFVLSAYLHLRFDGSCYTVSNHARQSLLCVKLSALHIPDIEIQISPQLILLHQQLDAGDAGGMGPGACVGIS